MGDFFLRWIASHWLTQTCLVFGRDLAVPTVRRTQSFCPHLKVRPWRHRMNARDWLRKIYSWRKRSFTLPARRQRRRTRLLVENLEVRLVPSVTTLVNFSGSNGANPNSTLIRDSG